MTPYLLLNSPEALEELQSPAIATRVADEARDTSHVAFLKTEGAQGRMSCNEGCLDPSVILELRFKNLNIKKKSEHVMKILRKKNPRNLAKMEGSYDLAITG